MSRPDMNTLIAPKRVRPVLSWPGGKSRMLKHLLPMLPQHTCYCEPFAGGLALLLAKTRSTVEVVNDQNGLLVALYRCAQFHLEPLLAEMEFCLNARDNLRDLLAQPGLTDLQRAARFMAANRMSFGGGMKSYGVTKLGSGGACKSRQNALQALRELNARLDKVSIENQDYARCLATYDSPETLFFLDPPYVCSRPGAAYEGWDAGRMEEFAGRVLALTGQWIVTVGDCELTRDLFQGCQILPVETPNGSVNRRLAPTASFRELIIRPGPASR